MMIFLCFISIIEDLDDMYFDDEDAEKTLHVKDGKVCDLCNT